MRQAGVLAAAGLVALETMRGRLAEDHKRARRIAEGLAKMPKWGIDPAEFETNILFARWKGAGNARDAVEALKAKGVLSMSTDGERVRFLTHADVDDADADRLLEAAKAL
jgi:threonine aldolase